jgi:hypothetical protein
MLRSTCLAQEFVDIAFYPRQAARFDERTISFSTNAATASDRCERHQHGQ